MAMMRESPAAKPVDRLENRLAFLNAEALEAGAGRCRDDQIDIEGRDQVAHDVAQIPVVPFAGTGRGGAIDQVGGEVAARHPDLVIFGIVGGRDLIDMTGDHGFAIHGQGAAITGHDGLAGLLTWPAFRVGQAEASRHLLDAAADLDLGPAFELAAVDCELQVRHWRAL